ncbi:MAG: C40 family peptidase [Nocardioidaceae bacterium]|nr:C40 family peptidase [Nocardioidaceae bacterium]
MKGLRRPLCLLLAGALVSAPALPAAALASEPTAVMATTTVVRQDAWVAVSVATLWRTPGSPRPVDAPALANPARITRWLADLTTPQRRGLSGRADSQALLGDRVVVLRVRGAWTRVAVPDQPQPGSAHGYRGWVPTRQLSSVAPRAAADRATVVARLGWLHNDDATAHRREHISFGTSLPVLGTTGDWVRVALPDGESRRIAAADVVVHPRGDGALPASRAGLVASAKKFLGLPYLWAGRSGFGLDCSGLTSLVHEVHGLRIPRDASPQSRAGSVVGGAPHRGDLLFFATGGTVHHVSLYVGHGRMIHSPHTGSTVSIIATSTPAYAAEYAGARSYLP